ncbi:MAG: DUF4013 domain-containing protein [Opitutales bacterium]
MPRIESLSREVWKDNEFRFKWVLGGVLGSIPLLNLLVLGYFLRYARQLRHGGDLHLPEWDNWGDLLLDGVRMLVLQLVFLGLPVLAGLIVSSLLSWLLTALYLGFFGSTVAWLFFFGAMGLGLLLWSAALQRYLPSQDWGRVFDLPAVWGTALRMLPAMVVPTLCFWGLMFIGWPLLGFTFFLGFGPYVAYGTAAYMKRQQLPMS